MRLRYERGALADLDELFAYIAKESRAAASQATKRIQEAVARIAASPYIGKETREPRFRQFRVGHYLIVYELNGEEITIFYVRHDARLRPWEGE
jgi:plasmid stabilization system protein ParE